MDSFDGIKENDEFLIITEFGINSLSHYWHSFSLNDIVVLESINKNKSGALLFRKIGGRITQYLRCEDVEPINKKL